MPHKAKYIIQKSWFAFWQKYKLAAQYRNLRKLITFLIIVWLIGSILTITSQWLFLKDLHHSIKDYARYFWYVIIELVSGFDIPVDEIPLHLASQIVSILMLIMGIIVVGLFTGQIISMFVHVLQRTDYYPEKPSRFRFLRPIIICGFNRKLPNILKELRSNNEAEEREILIVDENADKIKRIDDSNLDDIWYMAANPCDREVLSKAIGKADTRVIILSKDENSESSGNSSAISTALAVEAFDDKVHTVVEVPKANDVLHYQATKINECIYISEFSLKLISQTALRPGIASVYSQLFGETVANSSKQQIYFSHCLPACCHGKSYRQVLKKFASGELEIDFTLIGYAKFLSREDINSHNLKTQNMMYYAQVNPVSASDQKGENDFFVNVGDKVFLHKDAILTAHDKLIYIAAVQINFANL